MHVVHLLDQAATQFGGTTLAMMAQALAALDGKARQQVLLFGNAKLQQLAGVAGIDRPVRLSAPFGRAMFGWSAFRRYVHDNERIDLVHCWSIESLALATLALRRVPRVLTLSIRPSRRALRWLRVLCRQASSPVALLAASDAVRRALLAGGLPEPVVHVLYPGIDATMVTHELRAAVRNEWGIESDQTKLLTLLCDPPHAADALVAAKALMLAADAHENHRPSVRLLVHPDQAHLFVARRLLAGLGRRDWIICDRRAGCPWQVLPGCDVAIAAGLHAGAPSLAWAMAAGVPIVGEATRAVSEFVQDRHSALLVHPDTCKSLAHRITQLMDDNRLAERLGDTARSEAARIFSCDRYRSSIQAIYAQLMAR